MIAIPPRATSIAQGYEGISGRRPDNRYYPVHVEGDPPLVRTIGRGHVVRPGENFDAGLTFVEVSKLFCADMQPRAERLKHYFDAHTRPGAPPVQEHEFAGALSCFFNCEEPWTPGAPCFQLFMAGKKLHAMAHLMLYTMADHKHLLGLWRRRGTEALCILTSNVIIAKDAEDEARLFTQLRNLGVHLNRPEHLY